MRIIAYHGWGCDDQEWASWQDAIPDGYSFESWNRGYFGKEAKESSTDFDIVITHSMGLLHVPDDILSKAKYLIALQSFAYFPSHDVDLANVVIHQLDRMIHNMSSRPVDQIQTFRRQAGFRFRTMEEDHLNIDLLIDDLQRLKTDKIKLDLIRTIPNVYWIHEEQDRIIQATCRLELENNFPNHTHQSLRQGSHAYCLSYPETIVSRIFRNEFN